MMHTSGSACQVAAATPSAGTCRAWCCSFLRGVLGSDPSMTWKIGIDNTAVTELAWCADGPAAGWHLRRVNDTAHLVVAGLPGA